jgi:hypothetical protein
MDSLSTPPTSNNMMYWKENPMENNGVHLVPLLDSGRHRDPGKGACLLELVGTLPGGPWTDHPDTVGAVLSSLARAVNDRTSPAGRPALAPLIPWLAGLPRLDRPARVAALLATTAAAAARPSAGPTDSEQLSIHVAAARDMMAPPGPRGWRARRRQHLAAVRAVSLAVKSLAFTSGDEALRLLLVDSLNQVRALHGLPATAPLTRPAADCRVAVPIRSELRIPGGDATYLYCTAVLDAWPIWLRAPWDDASATSPTLRQGQQPARHADPPTGPTQQDRVSDDSVM